MIINNCEIAVLIRGRAISEYQHRGQTFIEGRAGSNYEIEVHNRNPFRVEVVLSVDGQSVTDGKQAGPQSSGFLIEANSSLRVPGWKIDNQQAAAFAFSGKQDSYSTTMTGSSRNNGVIGAMVFRERVAAYVGWNTSYNPLMSQTIGNGYFPAMGQSINVVGSPFQIARFYSGNDAGSTIGSAVNLGIMQNASSATLSASTCQYMGAMSATTTEVSRSIAPVAQTLGTAFGEATGFSTQAVEFNRGDLLAMMVLYYDDKRGLQARGIVMAKPPRPRVDRQPDAFPGMATGCAIPPGWKG